MGFVEQNKKIYEESFSKYGDCPKSCHWDEKMVFRYKELINSIDLNGASVLEIGCGIGGFYDYCVNDASIKGIIYTGIDLVEGMIDLAKKKYPEAEFMVHDIMKQDLQEQYDYVILCGVFNIAFNTADMQQFLAKAFKYCKKAMVFNFISTYVNFVDEEMSYHCPEEVFSFCAKYLSSRIKMSHHYEKCDVSMVVYKQ